LADMLRAMHLIVNTVEEAFEPESGAYAAGGHGHGHAHGHDHAHDHAHEHAHDHGHRHEPGAAVGETPPPARKTINIQAAPAPHVHGPGCVHDHGHGHNH
ncbi:urease accessory protein UreE, partial [Klebsiella pneumoniae]|nr:urease accessory protein UreE [Klebsiella pneumoniae]